MRCRLQKAGDDGSAPPVKLGYQDLGSVFEELAKSYSEETLAFPSNLGFLHFSKY